MEIYTTPTREEFFDYAYKHGIESQNEDKYNKQVHKLCTEAYWNTCEQYGIEKLYENK